MLAGKEKLKILAVHGEITVFSGRNRTIYSTPPPFGLWSRAVDAEEREIYYFLRGSRHEYISSREICRRAGGKKRFVSDPGWGKPVLNRMVERGILEMDPAGHYRIKPPEEEKAGKRKQWVSPQIARILTQSGKDFTHVVMSEDYLDRYYDNL